MSDKEQQQKVEEQRKTADKLNQEELDKHQQVQHSVVADVRDQQDSLNLAISQVNDEKLADSLRKQKAQLGEYVKETQKDE